MHNRVLSVLNNLWSFELGHCGHIFSMGEEKLASLFKMTAVDLIQVRFHTYGCLQGIFPRRMKVALKRTKSVGGKFERQISNKSADKEFEFE